MDHSNPTPPANVESAALCDLSLRYRMQSQILCDQSRGLREVSRALRDQAQSARRQFAHDHTVAHGLALAWGVSDQAPPAVRAADSGH